MANQQMYQALGISEEGQLNSILQELNMELEYSSPEQEMMNSLCEDINFSQEVEEGEENTEMMNSLCEDINFSQEIEEGEGENKENERPPLTHIAEDISDVEEEIVNFDMNLDLSSPQILDQIVEMEIEQQERNKQQWETIAEVPPDIAKKYEGKIFGELCPLDDTSTFLAQELTPGKFNVSYQNAFFIILFFLGKVKFSSANLQCIFLFLQRVLGEILNQQNMQEQPFQQEETRELKRTPPLKRALENEGNDEEKEQKKLKMDRPATVKQLLEEKRSAQEEWVNYIHSTSAQDKSNEVC